MLDILDPVDLGGIFMLLAQEGAGTTSGQEGGVGVPDGASLPPVNGGNGTATPAPSPFSGMMPIFIGFIVLLFFVSVLGPRREKKKREAMMNALNKHDRVQTIGGVVGTIVEIKPEHVVLKVDENSNTRITFSRTAIQQVLDAAAAGDSGN